jgi:hypothetical protein
VEAGGARPKNITCNWWQGSSPAPFQQSKNSQRTCSRTIGCTVVVNRSLAFKVDVDLPRRPLHRGKGQWRQSQIETDRVWPPLCLGQRQHAALHLLRQCLGTAWRSRLNSRRVVVIRFRLVQADILRRVHPRSSGCGVRQIRSMLSSSWELQDLLSNASVLDVC